MQDLLVDSNVILDVFTDDSVWGDWSESMLDSYSITHLLYINPIIYSEISIGFARIEELEKTIEESGFQMRQISKEALFRQARCSCNIAELKGTSFHPYLIFILEPTRLSKVWLS